MKVAKFLMLFDRVRLPRRIAALVAHINSRMAYLFNEWVLTTNHRRIAIMYFLFIVVSGFVGLILATIIRVELAYPGHCFLTQNAERYLTLISVHGIVMVFFVVIPLLFGGFANFLLPTQLGVRDVAFPRLNSFMFWLTPSGFVLLVHIVLFDRSYNVVQWLNYGELRAQLQRRNDAPQAPDVYFATTVADSTLAWRLVNSSQEKLSARGLLLSEAAPSLNTFPSSLVSLKDHRNLSFSYFFESLSFGFSSFLAFTTSLLSFVFLGPFWGPSHGFHFDLSGDFLAPILAPIVDALSFYVTQLDDYSAEPL